MTGSPVQGSVAFDYPAIWYRRPSHPNAVAAGVFTGGIGVAPWLMAWVAVNPVPDRFSTSLAVTLTACFTALMLLVAVPLSVRSASGWRTPDFFPPSGGGDSKRLSLDQREAAVQAGNGAFITALRRAGYESVVLDTPLAPFREDSIEVPVTLDGRPSIVTLERMVLSRLVRVGRVVPMTEQETAP